MVVFILPKNRSNPVFRIGWKIKLLEEAHLWNQIPKTITTLVF